MKNYRYAGLVVLGVLMLSMITMSTVTAKEGSNPLIVVEENDGNDYLDVIESNFQGRSLGSRAKDSDSGTIAVKDPTGKNNVYTLEAGAGLIELNASRGQTSRHFYNTSSGEYTFSSDYMVIEPGVIEGTDWVTMDEFPNRLVVRMNDGKVHALESSAEITDFFSTSDNSSILAVGLETFTGMMGFYFNSKDADKAHGQYLYWPRLTSGKITGYDKPLYEWYTRIQAELGEETLEAVLQDRISFPADPVNNLHVDISGNSYSVYYSVENQKLWEATCDLVHGFKYSVGDDSFHTITEFRSMDTDFDDIGVTYELLTAPQVSGTDHGIESFILTNGTNDAVLSNHQTWKAVDIFEDYLPSAHMVSIDGEGIYFDFSDMVDAGFAQNIMEFQETVLPGNINVKSLSCGMSNHGKYTKGTWVKIDPTVTDKKPTDYYDLYKSTKYREFPLPPLVTYTTGANIITVGYSYGRSGDSDIEGFVAIDTGIVFDISSTIAATYSMYFVGTLMESNEYINLQVYNIGGNDDPNMMKENSQSWSAGTNTYISGWSGYQVGWESLDVETLTDYWCSNRDNDENYISFRLYAGSGCDWGTVDWYQMYESTKSGYEPKLSFTYLAAKYALIVDGGDDNEYTHDALNMFNVLNESYSFTNDSIYLITYDDVDQVTGADVPRDRAVSKDNIVWAINEIADNAELGDQVIIWWNGHGHYSKLYTDSFEEFITDADLDDALDNIICTEMFIFIEACYSGSCIDELDDNQNRVIYTSAGDHDSNGEANHMHWGWATIRALNATLNASDADDNSDGRISLYEIYDYAEWYVQVYKSYPGQEPQRWVGNDLDDDYCYIDDGYY